MPFLGSKYAKIAFAGKGGEKKGGEVAPPFLKFLDPPLNADEIPVWHCSINR